MCCRVCQWSKLRPFLSLFLVRAGLPAGPAQKHWKSGFFLGDKFGESLGGSQATPSFWEVPGLPQKFPKLPQKFFGDFPGSSLAVELYSNPGVPRKFHRLPRKFPGLPRKFPGLPRRSALSLGSLTPSPDSQKLSLIFLVTIFVAGCKVIVFEWPVCWKFTFSQLRRADTQTPTR